MTMKVGRTFPDRLRRYLPILTWGAEYSLRTFANDLVAAAIVSIMLIPQSRGEGLLGEVMNEGRGRDAAVDWNDLCLIAGELSIPSWI
jgi:hypothetical protein